MRNKIIYWLSTALLSFGMLGSGISQILHVKEMNELIAHVGYPLYFMYIIGVWKILGVIAILIPNFKLLKEWAYAGFFFLMTGALISHLILGDGGNAIFGPLFQTIFVILSWYFRPADRKLNYTSN
ncbi:MAG: DoxX family protein [Bacteroidia bacterium]|nr:DoxX family protein [Bacteroidia bacterium]MCF8425128.1 DoxX family protein [Bacteroidia bacterium]MCF8446651.1 DoxX family protein [Bacteroidia bacterium]